MSDSVVKVKTLDTRRNIATLRPPRLTFPRKLGFAFITIGVGFALALLIAELTIRLFLPTYLWKFRDATDDWELDSRVGWKQKAGLNVTTVENLENGGWVVHFQTNIDGLSPASVQRTKAAGVFRIMIFGNSTVVGRAVPQDQTINVHLERLLREAELGVEVINAGVQGYSTDQVYLRIQQLIQLYQPDAIFYGLCSNDFGGNVSREAYGLAKPMFKVSQEGELEAIPPSFPTDGKVSSFGSGPTKWIQASAVYRFLLPWTLKVRAHFLKWDQRNLLGLAPEIYYSNDAMREIDWVLFTALLRHIEVYAEKNGAEFYLYAHPAVEEVWDPFINQTVKELNLQESQYDRYALEKRLSQVAKGAGVHFIPMIDYFLTNEEKGPFHLLPRDTHANPTGYRLQAELIAVALKSSSRHMRSSHDAKPLGHLTVEPVHHASRSY